MSAAEIRAVTTVRPKIDIPADPKNVRHQALLEEYWQQCFPGYQVPSVPSWRWQLAGFQSQNPWTDFRGGGILALELMVSMSRSFHPVLRRVCIDALPKHLDSMTIKSATAPATLLSNPLYYPFAASFINLEVGSSYA